MMRQRSCLNSEFTKLSFEKIIERLGETVQVLETGGLGLDDTIKLFENGMKMARVCSEMLAAAELRVSRIKTTYGLSMDYEQEEDSIQEDE